MTTKESLELGENITQKIPSFHHHYHILYDISNVIKKEKINYVEIGAYAGASATLMLHNPKVNVVSIDIGNPVKQEDVHENISIFFDCTDKRFCYIEGSSHLEETKLKLLNKIKEIDILFIDGDHSYDSVIKDFEMYSVLVSKNGYIIFDDYHCDICIQVRPAVDFIVSNFKKNEFEVIGSLLNTFNAYPESFKSNNCFVLRKNEKSI
jgi:predicted O-methyltransferase YrrM